MSIANLINVPREFAQSPDAHAWTFSNSADHDEIIQAIQAQYGIRLNTYIVDPFPTSDLTGWFFRHQNLHDDMNGVLGLTGSDFTDLDVSDQTEVNYWALQHYQEHLAARIALGI